MRGINSPFGLDWRSPGARNPPPLETGFSSSLVPVRPLHAAFRKISITGSRGSPRQRRRRISSTIGTRSRARRAPTLGSRSRRPRKASSKMGGGPKGRYSLSCLPAYPLTPSVGPSGLALVVILSPWPSATATKSMSPSGPELPAPSGPGFVSILICPLIHIARGNKPPAPTGPPPIFAKFEIPITCRLKHVGEFWEPITKCCVQDVLMSSGGCRWFCRDDWPRVWRA
jgi:hypothetical protein